MALLGLPRLTSLITLIVLTAGLAPVHAEAPQALDEYQVKAVFLFNFAKFVEWPATVFPSAGAPIRICVLGQNPFGSSLEDTVRGKSVESRSLAIREVSNAQEACNCHILFFVRASQPKRLRVLLSDLKGCSVLTVGETEDFTSGGGVINFRLEGGRIRIEIDKVAAERAKLRISSKLLSLAQTAKK